MLSFGFSGRNFASPCECVDVARAILLSNSCCSSSLLLLCGNCWWYNMVPIASWSFPFNRLFIVAVGTFALHSFILLATKRSNERYPHAHNLRKKPLLTIPSLCTLACCFYINNASVIFLSFLCSTPKLLALGTVWRNPEQSEKIYIALWV